MVEETIILTANDTTNYRFTITEIAACKSMQNKRLYYRSDNNGLFYIDIVLNATTVSYNYVTHNKLFVLNLL